MPIVELKLADMEAGKLHAHFTCGAAAVILHGAGAINRLWSSLMENREETLPWEASLAEFAQNHHGTADITTSLGDVFYFQPGQHGYIARKIEIEASDRSGKLSSNPDSFIQPAGVFHIPQQQLQDIFGLSERIMQALSPSKAETPDFKAAFQRLKYQPSYAELKRLGTIIENSLGRWGRLGYAIDRSRQTALGKLNKKGVSDIMGMALMMTYLRPIAKGINRLFSPHDQSEHIVPGEHIIERPHLDHRYFSALFGNRDTIRTEVYSNAEWHELPVGLDSIAIFPGKLAERDLGIVPTLHRVVQTVSHRPEAYVDSRTSNVTVLLGAV